MADLFDADEARRLFRQAVDAKGGVCAFARTYQVSQGAVSDAYNGKRIGPSLLGLADLSRVEMYVVLTKKKETVNV